MPRPPDSERIDLKQMFGQVQAKMLADLEVNRVFEHGTSQGNATEETWRLLLETYLPKRYKVASAFVVNAAGKRSKQIDLAIYDDLESPPIFAHSAGIHLPIESVYAVFEVKSQMAKTWLRDAGVKAASVRNLQKRGQKRKWRDC